MRKSYEKDSEDAFKLSRSKIDLFVECPRCFYLDRVLGIGRPPGFPFTLNSAVDKLLKKEFDIHRVKGSKHPLQERYGIDVMPAAHKELDIWRENFKGIQYHEKTTNFIITGAIDDLWENSKGEYMVVDYKATAKSEQVVALDKEWHAGYKRQMEVYQWLLRQKGYKVSDTGYFVYCTGKVDAKAFDGKLEFYINLIAYEGNADWILPTLKKIKKCLNGGLPEAGPKCEYCRYRKAARESEKADPSSLYSGVRAIIAPKK
ncbi:MAG: PD-(D/E)XK nuclease family protein [bacterium]|nr:PD-(D/E)XK nuclease family protein [bacterium]